MRLGFLTACMPGAALADIAPWAEGAGYEALEVAAWPRIGDRDFTASHLDAAGLDQAKADEVRALFDRHGLELSSIAYYDNNLHPDTEARRAINGHVAACIEAAALLGCPSVGTFVGRDPGKTVAENLAAAEGVFKPLVDLAGERGVALIVENCPMEGWHPDGYPGNLAYSPELWEWMFSLGLLLNFDPSHLLWLGIDPVAALRPYVDRVAHAHAKDAEVFPARRDRYGVFGKTVERTDGRRIDRRKDHDQVLASLFPNRTGRGICRDHHLAMLVGDVGNGRRDRGAVGAEDCVDLVLGNQLLIKACRGPFVRLIVVDNQFDRPAEQAALRVQVLLTQQVALAAIAALDRVGLSGDRHGRADPKRLAIG